MMLELTSKHCNVGWYLKIFVILSSLAIPFISFIDYIFDGMVLIIVILDLIYSAVTSVFGILLVIKFNKFCEEIQKNNSNANAINKEFNKKINRR